MHTPTAELTETLQRWRQSQAELALLQEQLCTAIAVAAECRAEAPRDLILAMEAKRREGDDLLQMALDFLDAHSPVKTGMTGFGTL